MPCKGLKDSVMFSVVHFIFLVDEWIQWCCAKCDVANYFLTDTKQVADVSSTQPNIIEEQGCNTTKANASTNLAELRDSKEPETSTEAKNFPKTVKKISGDRSLMTTRSSLKKVREKTVAKSCITST